jgi:HSP90 family molecular chaperone
MMAADRLMPRELTVLVGFRAPPSLSINVSRESRNNMGIVQLITSAVSSRLKKKPKEIEEQQQQHSNSFNKSSRIKIIRGIQSSTGSVTARKTTEKPTAEAMTKTKLQQLQTPLKTSDEYPESWKGLLPARLGLLAFFVVIF